MEVVFLQSQLIVLEEKFLFKSSQSQSKNFSKIVIEEHCRSNEVRIS